MNSAEPVTLEKIYQLLLDINNRQNGFEQKLELIAEKLNYIDKRLEKLEKRVDFVENQQMEDRKILIDIWRDREKVTITFSKTFAFINIFIASMISGFVAFFIKQK